MTSSIAGANACGKQAAAVRWKAKSDWYACMHWAAQQRRTRAQGLSVHVTGSDTTQPALQPAVSTQRAWYCASTALCPTANTRSSHYARMNSKPDCQRHARVIAFVSLPSVLLSRLPCPTQHAVIVPRAVNETVLKARKSICLTSTLRTHTLRALVNRAPVGHKMLTAQSSLVFAATSVVRTIRQYYTLTSTLLTAQRIRRIPAATSSRQATVM